MGRRPKWGRPVNGVLLLNKATGITSNTALQQAKRLFFAKRAGHAGSLDPLATGVLPICFGEATKFSQYLLDADKRYTSTFRLGESTETGDCDGNIVARRSALSVSEQQVKQAMESFTGAIEQVPSMYSALKYQGKPFYKWAREGVTLPDDVRQPRQVTVHEYRLLGFRQQGDTIDIDIVVLCSKGTYVRTLAEDLGEALGVGAHVVKLHREVAGHFHVNDALPLSDLTQARADGSPDVLDHHLLPVDAHVHVLPAVYITEEMQRYFSQGQTVMSTEAYRFAKEGDMVRVFAENNHFLGVGCLHESSVAPKRLVN